MKRYFKEFESEAAAISWMRMKNQVACRSVYCMVDGPNGDTYCVVDSRTAIELGQGYRWEL